MAYIELGKSSQVEQEYIESAHADNLHALPSLASTCSLVQAMMGKPVIYILHVTASLDLRTVVRGDETI